MRSRVVAIWFGALAMALGVSGSASAENAGVLIITEVMYHPAGGGQDLEFVEVHNATPAPLDLSGWYFARGVNFTFPAGTWLDGGRYLVVCANEAAIRETYGITNTLGDWSACPPAGPDAGGASGCALSNAGETIEIAEPNGVVAARVSYNDRGKWPAAADGTGHSLEIAYVYSEPDDPDSWQASLELGGSPGVATPATAPWPVLINEGLLLTDGPRWIELFNTSTEPVDLSGYHVTDERSALDKSTLAEGTTIPARGHLQLSDTELGLDFSPITEEGDDSLGRRFIALVTPDATRVVSAYIFRPEAEGESEARIPDGDEDWADRAAPTPGEPNRVDVETDVVINEVFYHPLHGEIGVDDSFMEFVELYNRSPDRTIDISGWRFTQGINYVFPEGTLIGPDEYLVVGKDPTYLVETYGLSPDRVLGPDPGDLEAIDDFGRLRDDGERLNLRDRAGRLADTVRYHDGGQWPFWADGGGSSMELIDPWHDNNVGAAWDSSDESAKAAPQEITYLGRYNGGEPEFHMYLNQSGITIVDDLRLVERVIVFEPEITYIDAGEEWRVFRGTVPPSDPVTAWYQPDFDDSDANGWFSGASPVGYGEDDEGTDLNSEELPEELRMRGNYLAFFLRKEFVIDDLSAIDDLALRLFVEYDDGYIAYLNGQRVVVENMRTCDECPGGFEDTIESRARSSREQFEHETDISEFKSLLRQGRNVLAVQVHNSSITSSDVRAIPKLDAGRFVAQDSENFIANGDFEEELQNPRTSPTSPPHAGLRPGDWKIEGTHVNSGRTTDPGEVLAGGGSLKLIAKGKGDYKVNRTEHTLLRAPATGREYTIAFTARWVAGAQTMVTRGYNHNYPKSHLLNVPRNLGTPGAVNSVTLRQVARAGAVDLGPVIDKVGQTPALPSAGQDVVVSARVQDPGGVGDVRLYWSLDTPRDLGSPQLEEVVMEGPDERGRYTGVIPGQDLRRRVVFFIVASDTGGQLGRYPVDPVASSNPKVLDPAAPHPLDQSFAVYRHDTPVNAPHPSYRFWLHSVAESYLNINRLLSNDRVEGSFLFGNRDIYHTSRVRFSGSPWARQRWTESYRVTMPKDEPLHGVIKRFGLEDHQAGGARNARERTSHYLIRHNQGNTRAPYSFQWLVQWQVGRGNTVGINEVREHVQTPNVELIQRWWPGDDDGDFFEMDDRFTFDDNGNRTGNRDGRLTNPPYPTPGLESDDPENYRYYFSTRLNESKDDFSRLVAFSKILDPRVTPNEVFDEVIWDHMNVEAFLRVLSIRLNTGDWDTWGYNRGKNCYVYRPAIEGRWYLLPWDMELTYEAGHQNTYLIPGSIAQTYSTNTGLFPELNRFWNRPRVKRMLYGILWEMVNGPFDDTFLTPYMNKLQQRGMTETQIGRAGGFVDVRGRTLRSRLISASSERVDFEITTNGGDDFESAEPVVTITGRAPIEVWSVIVQVNGRQLDDGVGFSNSDSLEWEATIPLSPGANTVSALAFTNEGEIFATDMIRVTSTFEGAPVIDRIEPDTARPGDLIAIHGSNFHAGVTVRFGEVEATEVGFDGVPERLDVVVPEGLSGAVSVIVGSPQGDSNAVTISIVSELAEFVRGDADVNGRIDINDPVTTLDYLFSQGSIGCEDAADFDDNGEVNLTDAIATLDLLFRRGPAPASPYPGAGVDPTTDALGCETGL